ncbi:MAG: RNA ligase family protein [Chloroflexota bacterium]|nr:RNA ligase family protein [Chloroflexota bacterium]
MADIYKYPRTQHIEGSGLQKGDEDLAVSSFEQIAGRHLVVEEKMDGANCALSFTEAGQLLLQSRGHYLVGGERERQFHLFKTWAARYTMDLWEALADRYVMYGEWLYAKHTVYYTDLPHYFLEFDIYDKAGAYFLNTGRRRDFLQRLPFISSVYVLDEGQIPSLQTLVRMIGPSHFIAADHIQRLRQTCQKHGLDSEQVIRETDARMLMEGLYIKVEEEGRVAERYKYVRAGFLQTVFDSHSHWLDRPIVPNGLKPGADLFGE